MNTMEGCIASIPRRAVRGGAHMPAFEYDNQGDKG